MPRTGLLIGLAALIIAAAVGVLVWTKFLDVKQPETSPTATVPSEVNQESSRAAELEKEMSNAIAGGGIAVTFSDADSSKWTLADGQRLEGFRLGTNGPVFSRLTSTQGIDEKSTLWTKMGLTVWIPKEFANESNGKKIEVGVIARSSKSNGSSALAAVYATHQAGNSGWQRLALQPEFQMLKFTFDVPKVEEGYSNQPALVFNSDSSGSGKAVELIGTYIKILN